MPHDVESGAKPAEACSMVIFGAGGDLTKRLVVPALYNLGRAGLLPKNFGIVGVDLAANTTEDWRKSLFEMTQQFEKSSSGGGDVDQEVWNALTGNTHYLQGDMTNDDTYQSLKKKLSEIECGCSNYLFYLAIADRFFGTVVEKLGQNGLASEEKGWRGVVIEKPFGHDLASAEALNRQILKVLDEKQVFRIDHFLGKETVQNIMMFRLPTACLSPCGIGIALITFKSPCRRQWAWRTRSFL